MSVRLRATDQGGVAISDLLLLDQEPVRYADIYRTLMGFRVADSNPAVPIDLTQTMSDNQTGCLTFVTLHEHGPHRPPSGRSPEGDCDSRAPLIPLPGPPLVAVHRALIYIQALTANAAVRIASRSTPSAGVSMKQLVLLSTLAMLAACAQSPTAPAMQSEVRPNLSVVLAPGTIRAARNPAGTGQPGQSCQSEPTQPNGFGTGGFANAVTRYAGSPGTPSLANGSSHAVSQYDVACYQLSNK
jgi:hypothetical protein